jgi:DNA-binding transcriptional MerR regulator
MTPNKRLHSISALRARYGRSTKTFDRWVKQGILPEPVRIRGHRYWYEADLVRLERASMGSRSNTTDTETEPQALPR